MTAFDFAPVTEADFGALVALRIATMRASLERIGRFDPQRAAERFRATFRPTGTQRIVVDAVDAGCIGFWAEAIAAAGAGARHANRFYRRHGFVRVSEDEWDIAYERPRHLAAG